MSGRLYEREFIAQEPEQEHEVEEVKKAEETAPESPEPKASGEEAPADPIVEQLNYQGTPEKVDTRLYRNRLVCGCGNVRWVKNADLFQVTKCKPCSLKERKERRRKGKA